MITNIKELEIEIEKIKQTFDPNTNYFGNSGTFKGLSNCLKTLIPEARPEAGRRLNELKKWLSNQLPDLQATSYKLQADQDTTIPGFDMKTGHVHPISQAIDEITRIFERIGFTRVRYPEVDWDWYAFESLNMAPNHPARDEWETFFVDLPDTTKDIPYDPENPRKRHPEHAGGKIVLTPHTSNGQVREMERLGKPPIRMINIARTYRRQADVTHVQMFHQFEGLVVDRGITIQNLKGTIEYFAHEFYGPEAKSRIRPFHFSFTEPSFEVDFSCTICGGTGYVDGNRQSALDIGLERQKPEATDHMPKVPCRFCKSGWHEVGGAGMVHPNVLRAGGIDPDEYTGFAFGWGIERTYTLRPGLHIDDIRMLYNGDLRLLEQF